MTSSTQTENFEMLSSIFQAIKDSRNDMRDLDFTLEKYNVVVSYNMKTNKWKCVSVDTDKIIILEENDIFTITLLGETLIMDTNSITFEEKYNNKLIKFNVSGSTVGIDIIAFFLYDGIVLRDDKFAEK